MSLSSVIVELEARLSKWETGIKEIRKALKYLKQYGYIHSIKDVTLEDIFRAVTKFQELANIVVDGEIGPKTLGAMDWPRCSVPDFITDENGNMMAFNMQKGTWGYRDLRYYVESRDSDLSAADWDRMMQKGFDQWSAVANLTFTQTNNRNDAHFILGTGAGSRDNFDGPSGTLAWAYLPPSENYRGQLVSKFDRAETWRISLSQGSGILLLNVACHEFGHLLGLEHSRINSALMAPFYNPSITKPQQTDDVTRIQRKYGPPVIGPDPDPDPPDPEPIPAPTNLTAVAQGQDVRLEWEDNSTGEDGFEVYRNGVRAGQVGRGVTGATDRNVEDGTYTYKIRAVLGEEVSEWSNEATATVGDPPDPPTDKLVINLTGNVTDIDIPGYTVTKN